MCIVKTTQTKTLALLLSGGLVCSAFSQVKNNSLITGFLLSLAVSSNSIGDTVSGADFAARRNEIMAHMLEQPVAAGWYKVNRGSNASTLLKRQINPVSARILSGQPEKDSAGAVFRTAVSLCDNTQDGPWSTTRSLWTTLLGQEFLPDDMMTLQKELLQRWNYDCSAGTVNMRLYLYVAGYLAAEYWPDFRDADMPVNTDYAIDFRGKTVSSKSAAEIKQYCKENIDEIFQYFAVKNQVEHSQIYFMCDIEAVKMLAEFSKDSEMRKRATMVLDYFMLNLATDWNQGYQAETFYRCKYYKNLAQTEGLLNTKAVGWLYFGARYPQVFDDLPVMFLFGEYQMPPVFEKIAHDRSAEREKFESHIFSSERETLEEAVIRKTFYHTPAYSLTIGETDYDGKKGIKTAVFKEQRALNLTWISEKPSSHFYVFQENYRQPYFGRTDLNNFGSGENPYSHRMQHQRTAIGLYDVPSGYEFYKQYITFVKSGAIVKQVETNSWIFNHAGNMLFGFYSMAPTTWERNTTQADVAFPVDIRWADARKNAWVLETADAGRYAGNVDEQLAAFINDVLKENRTDVSKMNKSRPEFSYKTISGDSLRIVFTELGKSPDGKHFINEQPVHYNQWKMLDSPWAVQDWKSPVVTVDFAGVQLRYDFENWTVDGDRLAVPQE